MSGEVGGEEPIGRFRFAGMNPLPLGRDLFILGLAEDGRSVDLEDVTVRAA
jgi:hypothetical protein